MRLKPFGSIITPVQKGPPLARKDNWKQSLLSQTMAFKLFVLATFVAIVAISHAQTTGSSSGEGAGNLLGQLTKIVPDYLEKVVEKLVKIIVTLGDFIASKDSLTGTVSFSLARKDLRDLQVRKLLNEIGAAVCNILQMVVQLLRTLTGKFELDSTAVNLCDKFRVGGATGGVSGAPGASTPASGSIGGL